MEKVLNEQQTLNLIIERIDKLTSEVKNIKPTCEKRIFSLQEINYDLLVRVNDLEIKVYKLDIQPITEENK